VSNPIVESLINHRSIRKFKPDPIDPETLGMILKAGTRGATAGNLQLYTLIVVDDKEKLKELGLGFAPMAVVSLVDLYRVKRWLEINVPSGVKIYNANAYHFFCGYCDAMIATQNIVVAAESYGLGTCYYGGILSTDVQEFFGTPEYVFPAAMVTLGYPDEEPDLSVRLPLEVVVHRNDYRHFTDEEIRDLYREREERVWNTLSEDLKEKLAAKGIHSIPQGVTRRKFSKESFEVACAAIRENIRNSKFEL
jgi:nitroreductase